jgi:hypothetical protein
MEEDTYFGRKLADAKKRLGGEQPAPATFSARVLVDAKKQLKVLIPVETDQRFKRLSLILGPTSHLLDYHAPRSEKGLLARLPESERELYLLGQSTCEQVFGRPSKYRRQPRSARATKTPCVQLNTLVSATTLEELKRYCRFMGIPFWEFLDRYSRGCEIVLLADLPPDRHPEYFAGKLVAADFFSFVDLDGEEG